MPILTYAHIFHSGSRGGNILSCLLLLWGPSGRCEITTLSKTHTFTGQNKKLPSQHFTLHMHRQSIFLSAEMFIVGRCRYHILFSKYPNLLYHWATPPLHVTANLVQRAQTTSPNVQCYAQRGQTYRGSYATPTSTQCLSCCRLADSSGSLPARTYTNKRCRICTQNDSNREHPCFFFLLLGIVCNLFAACLIVLLHVVYIVFKCFFLFLFRI